MVEGVDGAGAPPRMQVAMVALNALAFAAAAGAGGFLVGRFGGKAGQREATASGVLAGGIAWALALAQGAPAGALGWALLLVVMATLGGGAAYGGGRVGLRRRPRG
jgi:tRNA-(ms[2]io[6]A)-hydroxylase